MSYTPDLQRMIGRLRMRHLALLDFLGNDPNLGRAATQLHMSQPTASKLLKEIESIFEERLFVRNRRGMSPTLAGQVLTRRASLLLAELRATQLELNAAQQGASARLRIGVFPVVVPQLLPRMYTAMLARWPQLYISIQEAVEYPLLSQLSQGEIDCIVGRIVVDALGSDLRHEMLYTEPTAVVCGVHHPVLGAEPAQRKKILQDSAWMLPAPEGALYSMVAAWLATLGVREPRVVVETTSVFVTIEMLNQSGLLSILPQSVAQTYALLGRVAIVPQSQLLPHYPVGVIYRVGTADHPVMRMMLETARECAADSQP